MAERKKKPAPKKSEQTVKKTTAKKPAAKKAAPKKPAAKKPAPKKTEAKEPTVERYVTRRRFRELCGHKGEPLNYYTLTTDLRRGNIVEDENRVIDIAHPVNSKYIESKREYEKEKRDGETTDQKKKRVELEKSKRDLEMKEFMLAKMRGEYIPKDLVNATFKAHFKEVYQQFYFAAEQIATDYARQFGGSKEDMAKLKGALVETVNSVIKKGRESSAQKIKEIEAEYTATHLKQAS